MGTRTTGMAEKVVIVALSGHLVEPGNLKAVHLAGERCGTTAEPDHWCMARSVNRGGRCPKQAAASLPVFDDDWPVGWVDLCGSHLDRHRRGRDVAMEVMPR